MIRSATFWQKGPIGSRSHRYVQPDSRIKLQLRQRPRHHSLVQCACVLVRAVASAKEDEQ